VSFMQFYKGAETGKIYCREQIKNGLSMIVTAEIYQTRKTNITGQRELNLITKISNYDYQIKEYKNQS